MLAFAQLPLSKHLLNEFFWAIRVIRPFVKFALGISQPQANSFCVFESSW